MARRRFDVFSLSFLDVMACGLGAIVLFYMIINAQVAVRSAEANIELLSETSLLEEEVLQGRKDLIRVRNSMDSKRAEQEITEGVVFARLRAPVLADRARAIGIAHLLEGALQLV